MVVWYHKGPFTHKKRAPESKKQKSWVWWYFFCLCNFFCFYATHAHQTQRQWAALIESSPKQVSDLLGRFSKCSYVWVIFEAPEAGASCLDDNRIHVRVGILSAICRRVGWAVSPLLVGAAASRPRASSARRVFLIPRVVGHLHNRPVTAQ